MQELGPRDAGYRLPVIDLGTYAEFAALSPAEYAAELNIEYDRNSRLATVMEDVTQACLEDIAEWDSDALEGKDVCDDSVQRVTVLLAMQANREYKAGQLGLPILGEHIAAGLRGTRATEEVLKDVTYAVGLEIHYRYKNPKILELVREMLRPYDPKTATVKRLAVIYGTMYMARILEMQGDANRVEKSVTFSE